MKLGIVLSCRETHKQKENTADVRNNDEMKKETSRIQGLNFTIESLFGYDGRTSSTVAPQT
jgi:hypothetical protein